MSLSSRDSHSVEASDLNTCFYVKSQRQIVLTLDTTSQYGLNGNFSLFNRCEFGGQRSKLRVTVTRRENNTCMSKTHRLKLCTSHHVNVREDKRH